jgi:hypothetical protein
MRNERKEGPSRGSRQRVIDISGLQETVQIRLFVSCYHSVEVLFATFSIHVTNNERIWRSRKRCYCEAQFLAAELYLQRTGSKMPRFR